MSSASVAPAGRTWYRRLGGRLPTVAWLTVMWVVLWGDLSPGTVLAGVAVASLCYSVARLPHIPVRLGLRPLNVALLVGRVGYDLLASSLRVAYRGLWSPGRTRGAIVAVPVRIDSDFLLAILSGLLSLITGTLVIELNRDQGVIYVHGFPVHDTDAVETLRVQVRAIEERLVFAFGTAEDVAVFRELADPRPAGDATPGAPKTDDERARREPS